ncbi:MAG: S-adenosylmethionine:tRNA ribosyltransferase-isomerase, partial [Myxococcota bacterium]
MTGRLDLDDYGFDLPPEQIAQHPAANRDEARLLGLDRSSGEIAGDHRVRDLPGLLLPGDLLVVNATRVLSARLVGRKATGGRAEALLLGPDEPGRDRVYRALLRSGGRLRPGLRFEFGEGPDRLAAEIVVLHPGGEVTLAFEAGPDPMSLGEAPLPPYIQRDPQAEDGADQRALDLDRYQTVYAREPGAVAAPTAGLHLTRSLLDDLAAAGVGYAEVVLHVGLGTFRPIGPARSEEHT